MIDSPDNNDALGQPSSEAPLGGSPKAHRCEDTPSLIMQVLEGVPNPQLIQAVRVHFGSCLQCQNALDLEIRRSIFRHEAPQKMFRVVFRREAPGDFPEGYFPARSA